MKSTKYRLYRNKMLRKLVKKMGVMIELKSEDLIPNKGIEEIIKEISKQILREIEEKLIHGREMYI